MEVLRGAEVVEAVAELRDEALNMQTLCLVRANAALADGYARPLTNPHATVDA